MDLSVGGVREVKLKGKPGQTLFLRPERHSHFNATLEHRTIWSTQRLLQTQNIKPSTHVSMEPETNQMVMEHGTLAKQQL